jgi:hypothetical protein
MKRSKFLERTGFGRIANHETKELHRVDKITRNCHIARIEHGGYCTALWAYALRKLCRYDGCFFCNRKHHNN